MKVLLLHNYYRCSGGEDAVVEQEKTLLQAKGHDVRLLSADNGSITGLSAQVASALGATYSRNSRLRLEEEIGSFRPDVVHVHNFFLYSRRRCISHAERLVCRLCRLCTTFA